MNRDVLRLINNFTALEKQQILSHLGKEGLKELYGCFEFEHKNAKDTIVTDPDWRTNLFEKVAALTTAKKYPEDGEIIGNGITRFNLYIADPRFYIYDIQQMVRDFLNFESTDFFRKFTNNI